MPPWRSSSPSSRPCGHLRENISEAQRIEGVSIKHDIAVPVSRIAEFIARADDALRRAFSAVRIVTFGHIGDGNLHYNLSKPDAAANAEFIAQTAAGQSHRARHRA
jgi:FAD/FMN-containing dehydrogenase